MYIVRWNIPSLFKLHLNDKCKIAFINIEKPILKFGVILGVTFQGSHPRGSYITKDILPINIYCVEFCRGVIGNDYKTTSCVSYIICKSIDGNFNNNLFH